MDTEVKKMVQDTVRRCPVRLRVPVTSGELTVLEATGTVTSIPREAETVKLGDWYWITDEGYDGKKLRWLGCVMHVGSNFIRVESPHADNGGYKYKRVHLDKLHECRREPDPMAYIRERREHHQQEVRRLLGRVQEITALLGVGECLAIEDGSQEATMALATVSGTPDVDTYKEALVRAKDEQLPELFRQIKEEHKELEVWMAAETMPLKAQCGNLQAIIGMVNGRIFNVELYAGLTEQVEQITDGDPAAVTDKLHVMQRRCYMDEECLLGYETGGIEIKDMRHFDAWLVKRENMERVLPFPRCMVVFRVRRNVKDRSGDQAMLRSPFLRVYIEQSDKRTFMYIRNGDRVYRMNTSLEFDEKVFPDSHEFAAAKVWARTSHGHIHNIVSDSLYQQMVVEDRERKRKEEEWSRDNPSENHWRNPHRCYSDRPSDYEQFNHDSVYYDDIAKEISDRIQKYNRIALIIQGLLDRSEVLHPHPPARLWTPDGFAAIVRLVYDRDRALHAGPKPDFELYRAKCNATLKVGSVTIGQQDVWLDHECEKQRKQWERSYRRGDFFFYRQYGNPGPGKAARVVGFQQRAKKCLFKWERRRLGDRHWGRSDTIPVAFTCGAEKLLNADAYKPGDFRQFFEDSRTRAEYLKWAPILLLAEEYQAGNLEIGSDSDD